MAFKLEDIQKELTERLNQRGFSQIEPFKRAHPAEQFRFERRESLYGIQAGLDEEFWDEKEQELRCFYVNVDYHVPPKIYNGEKVVPDSDLTRAILGADDTHKKVGFQLASVSPASCPRDNRFQAIYGIDFSYETSKEAALSATADLISYVARFIIVNCDTACGINKGEK